MPKFIINGRRELQGTIRVKGAKNAALKIIPAALLSKEKITIHNVPDIEDVRQAVSLAKELGATAEMSAGKLEIQADNLKKDDLSFEVAGKFRASIIFVGPILARIGEVKFPLPGGCSLASGAKRPIDLFLDGFVKFGAEITAEKNHFCLKASKLIGCEYFFTTVSVTGTETLMITAVLADGKTVLKNCACEPEIKSLADYLNQQGAKINGAGTPTITIEGVKEISAGNFTIIPDRIETGTFAIMAAATKSELLITDCLPDHIEVILSIFSKIGIPYEKGIDWLKIKKFQSFNSFSIKTHEYPGFPTDLQSPYTVLMTQAQGASLIHETIYDRRLLYVDMLMQMGADIIMCDPHRVVINGPKQLFGKKLTSPDIRAGIAMIIAGLIANGTTEIDNIYQIDRGYEDIDRRLKNLGADIKRLE